MSNDKELVVYVGPYSFPDGGAAARRIYGNCLSLRRAGYDVVVTTGKTTNEQLYEYKGFPVVPLDKNFNDNDSKVVKYLKYFSSANEVIKWLSDLSFKPKPKPKAIILYSGYLPYLVKLIPWCKKNKIKLIFDAVEWYDPNYWYSYLISPYYISLEIAMRWLNKKCDSLIVISSHLENYYDKTVDKVVKIPPTVDCEAISARLSYKKTDLIKLVFAGSPGKKDLLALIIQAVKNIAIQGNKIELHVAGLTDIDFKKYLKRNNCHNICLKEIVISHGVLNHDETLELVKNSDYSIFIRPSILSVQAGFPTKFVESLAVGTPVIANITSDLGLYLKNKVNGLVCAGSDLKDIEEVINKCYFVDNYKEMRSNARQTAEKNFDFNVFSDAIKHIVN